MGEEDYLFLPTVQQLVQDHKSSRLVVVENCGHVVNVEQPQFFNDTVISYLLAK